MDPRAGKPGRFRGLYRRLAALTPLGAKAGHAGGAEAPGLDAFGLLAAVQAGGRPEYCLYVGPTKAKAAGADLERLLADGFAPLPVVAVDGYKSPLRRLPADGQLAAEAFAALAARARVLLVVPVEGSATAARVRWLKDNGHLWRAVFFMPDAGAFGTDDWAAAWERARRAVESAGVELPPYTGGGWLFRYAAEDAAPRAATFRLIAHPNPEKIAKALDEVCGEMGEGK